MDIYPWRWGIYLWRWWIYLRRRWRPGYMRARPCGFLQTPFPHHWCWPCSALLLCAGHHFKQDVGDYNADDFDQSKVMTHFLKYILCLNYAFLYRSHVRERRQNYPQESLRSVLASTKNLSPQPSLTYILAGPLLLLASLADFIVCTPQLHVGPRQAGGWHAAYMTRFVCFFVFSFCIVKLAFLGKTGSIRTFFCNFQNLQTVLCYILIDKKMLEMLFCSNLKYDINCLAWPCYQKGIKCYTDYNAFDAFTYCRLSFACNFIWCCCCFHFHLMMSSTIWAVDIFINLSWWYLQQCELLIFLPIWADDV